SRRMICGRYGFRERRPPACIERLFQFLVFLDAVIMAEQVFLKGKGQAGRIPERMHALIALCFIL
ncbi:MAG: hypothetical protein WCL08_10240, partial [Verrucomicrobiota bacterium]